MNCTILKNEADNHNEDEELRFSGEEDSHEYKFNPLEVVETDIKTEVKNYEQQEVSSDDADISQRINCKEEKNFIRCSSCNNYKRSDDSISHERFGYLCDDCDKVDCLTKKEDNGVNINVQKGDEIRPSSNVKSLNVSQTGLNGMTGDKCIKPSENIVRVNSCKKNVEHPKSDDAIILPDQNNRIPDSKPTEVLVCDQCESIFDCSSTDLCIHLRIPLMIKSSSCKSCKKLFVQSDDLNSHICLHTKHKRFRCDICKRLFTKLCDLNQHNRTHTGEKPYVCEICKTSFSRLGALNRHSKIHTNEKEFKCDQCDRSFNRLDHFKYHVRMHSDDKPFSCTKCDKSFLRLDHLNSHIRTHNGDKPYTCELCKNSFTKLHDLKRHLRRHTGEKPFSCDVCDKSFTQIGNLYRHKQTHTSEKPVD